MAARSICTVAVQCAALALAAGVLTAQTPARDPGTRSAAPVASISGVVMSDDAAPRPLRHARVALSGDANATPAPVLTSDDGHFTFQLRATGRFTLTVTKPGYVRQNYGAARADRRGTSITVAPGQQVSGLTIRLTKGSVIAGLITDETGNPAANVPVRAMQYRMTGDDRVLAPALDAGFSEDRTDDRGAYRLYGLPAGDYVVVATPQIGGGDIRALTESGGWGARNSTASPARTASAPQAPPAPRPDPPDGSSVSYAPVFFPGVTSAGNASLVTLSAANERTDVNFQLQLVHTARVSGQLIVPPGVSPQSVQLALTPSAGDATMAGGPMMMARPAITSDGRFTFTGVAPGQYTISARTGGGAMIMQMGGDTMTMAVRAPSVSVPPGGVVVAPGGRGGSAPPAPQFWAIAPVTVQGLNLSGIALTLQPAMTLSGRVAFQPGGRTPPPDLSQVRVMLDTVSTPGTGLTMGVPQASVDATGAFKVTGVVPGRYRVSGLVIGSSPWTTGSVLINGRDVLDLPLEIGPGEEVANAVVTFTDARQTVSGTLRDASGRPAADFTILVFAADSQYWRPGSRRIATARPGIDGRFTIESLPAGDYRIAALTDIAPGDAADRTFLAAVVDASVPFTLAPGEKKTQDFRIGR